MSSEGKVREFWIDDRYFEFYSEEKGPYKASQAYNVPMDKWIHVIEMSAYLTLQEKCRVLELANKIHYENETSLREKCAELEAKMDAAHAGAVELNLRIAELHGKIASRDEQNDIKRTF